MRPSVSSKSGENLPLGKAWMPQLRDPSQFSGNLQYQSRKRSIGQQTQANSMKKGASYGDALLPNAIP
jgi:hypothetical protein